MGTTIRQLSFAGGELAPSLYARTDQSKFAYGARVMRNGYVMKNGGWTNRPGSDFVGEVRVSSTRVRLIPFVFSDDQSYVLELGQDAGVNFANPYMRVIRNGAHVTDLSLTITGFDNANPAKVYYSGTDTGLTNYDEVTISGVAGALGNYLNGRNFKIANVDTTANTFTLLTMDGATAIDSTSWGTWTSGGTAARIYQVIAYWGSDDQLRELRYAQSADVLSAVHSNETAAVGIYEITRSGHSSWTISVPTLAPVIGAPTNLARASGSAATGVRADDVRFVVTAVADGTYEESLASSELVTGTGAITMTWTASTNAIEYNIYVQKVTEDYYSYVGTSPTTTYFYQDIDPDYSSIARISALKPFSITKGWPRAVAYFQQRRAFGCRFTDNIENIWLSRIGSPKNFSPSFNLQSDDSFTIDVRGKKVSRISHMLEAGVPLVFTDSAEYMLQGDQNNTLVPGGTTPKYISGYGISPYVAPLEVEGGVLFVQKQGKIVRLLGDTFQADGYQGNDVTVFAKHLTKIHPLCDWTYQMNPHGIIWAVRNEDDDFAGDLLGLTFNKEHQLIAWHRHDTDGVFESVVTIPEDGKDVVYAVVRRTIDGSTKRYVERFTNRDFDDIKDAVFMDSALTYDGRNTAATTMTISTGSAWTVDTTLTLTASASYFSASEVGNEIHFFDSDGELLGRFFIDAYTSATVVTGRFDRDVPAALRATATTTWTRAVDEVTGLWHLEGQAVSVSGDGYVVASPNNENFSTITVTNGTVTLPRCYGVIHVGLPYISDLETLDIDQPSGQTLATRMKKVNAVGAQLEQTRGLWVGGRNPGDDDPLDGLSELLARSDEGYDEPVSLETEKAEVRIEPQWNSNGRVLFRQVDPLPCTILAVYPTVEVE